MTPKQRDFVTKLACEREIPSDEKGTYVLKLIAGNAPEPNVPQTSKIIEWLLALPRKATAPVEDVEVPPAGRYALVHPERGHVEFFVVDRPEEGKWQGYTFVKQQASDDKYPVKGARRNEVLARIAADPREAMVRYGHELGRCGNCGRTLTDEVSRAMGIGPDCAAKLGYERITEAEAVAAKADAVDQECSQNRDKPGCDIFGAPLDPDADDYRREAHDDVLTSDVTDNYTEHDWRL